MNNLKTICGIDTLYYFCESNNNYDNLFLEILDQIETQKGKFEKKDLDYENNEINIILKDEYLLKFLGKAQGFYWFKDYREYFKIGFKDTKTNQDLNDIQVQLLSTGIYTLGIKSLISYINDDFLKDVITDYFPVTRVDINCFINYDFSFLTKDMFVTRKRTYATVSEIGTATKTQTIYIGKKPFLLRIYDKKEELKKSKKKSLMYEYFLNNGLDTSEDIYNLEFELHRSHLKLLELDTLINILNNVNTLFKLSMQEIKMVDLNSISKKQIINNKYKANTHPIWKQLEENYNYNEFHQQSLPLQRIKRIISIYDDSKFQVEFISLIRKAYINNIVLDDEYINTLYIKAKDTFKQTINNKEIKKGYVDIRVNNNLSNKKETYRYLQDSKEIIKPIQSISVNLLSDYDLQIHYEKSLKNINISQFHKDIYYIAKKEMFIRNLIDTNNLQLENNEVNKYGF
jgi:hypothetical protein